MDLNRWERASVTTFRFSGLIAPDQRSALTASPYSDSTLKLIFTQNHPFKFIFNSRRLPARIKYRTLYFKKTTSEWMVFNQFQDLTGFAESEIRIARTQRFRRGESPQDRSERNINLVGSIQVTNLIPDRQRL